MKKIYRENELNNLDKLCPGSINVIMEREINELGVQVLAWPVVFTLGKA